MSLSGDVCVVTGACGFLGKRLVQLLLEEEKMAEIRILDKHVELRVIQKLQEIKSSTRLRAFEGDIRNADFVRRACGGASVVFHTASVIDVNGSVEYQEMYGVNVTGTELLLDACLQEGVASFIYTSSIEVTGPNPQGDPVVDGDEDTSYTCTLKFPYSRTKKEAELRTLRAHGGLQGTGGRLATLALRPMYIYGEGCRFLLGHMGDGIRNHDVLYRLSRPDARVNPVYVGNVAAAHLQAARSLKDPERRNLVGGKFYFVADDTPPVSYSDFNHAVMAPLGFGIREKLPAPLGVLYALCFLLELLCFLLRPLVRVTPPLSRQLLTMLNTPFSFSYRRARRDLGYRPVHGWEEARRRTVEWLAEQLPRERQRIRG